MEFAQIKVVCENCYFETKDFNLEGLMDIELIKTYWKGIELNSGVPSEQIEELEREINFQFPDEFKELYKDINGFKDRDWTENMLEFLPLSRIKDEYNYKGNDENFIPIFDYLIASHHIGYLKGESGFYKSYNCEEPVCSNLMELIELIKIDSEKLY